MVESNALLKRRTSKGYRGFESLSLRHSPPGAPCVGHFENLGAPRGAGRSGFDIWRSRPTFGGVKTSKRPRQSRLRTTARILDGARAALVEHGWQGWGINAVAARSGVQKVLIYRYFEGMEGLCSALAAEAVIFPAPAGDDPAESASAEDLLRAAGEHWEADSFAAYLARLRAILPAAHPFAGSFDRQRAAFTAALAAALRRQGRDPAEAPAHTALLLDFTRPGNTPVPDRLPTTRPSAAEEELPVELL